MQPAYSVIDGHVHLDQIKDLDRTLADARNAGVSGIIAVGMDLDSNRRTLELARIYSGYIHPAIGYHPLNVRREDIPATLEFIARHIDSVVGIGEIGLDYKAKVKKNLQKEAFARMLEIASRHDKTVIIHARLSHARCYEMVREAGIRKAVFHWYSGPTDLLEKILQEGYFVSATPALQYSPKHQEAVSKAPLDRILIETDSPVVYGELESRPADVLITLREVAHLKGMDPDVVARVTEENTRKLFELERR